MREGTGTRVLLIHRLGRKTAPRRPWLVCRVFCLSTGDNRSCYRLPSHPLPWDEVTGDGQHQPRAVGTAPQPHAVLGPVPWGAASGNLCSRMGVHHPWGQALSNPCCLCSQCWGGPQRHVHCSGPAAAADEAGEGGGHVWCCLCLADEPLPDDSDAGKTEPSSPLLRGVNPAGWRSSLHSPGWSPA